MMRKFLILYTSTTGSTEQMAEVMEAHLKANNCEVEMQMIDFYRLRKESFTTYDAVLIGTYTWNNGESPYEMEDFLEELDRCDLSGPVFAVFGSADSFYDTYGAAIDLVYDLLQNKKCNLMPQTLKVNLQPKEADIASCKDFVNQVLEVIQQ
ncbi:flavodoxin domain-containing protein [Virgibacillus sp. LDC-1]|uniref:flavodoxin domain-containing protein n=1 Tax=Virgibacillus sp. LDC-1 TaxID=3039856 RepID=UPI0024DE7707|nr:flavodoxin domain-containing protein [Virgibacillus sp. LDC-1]